MIRLLTTDTTNIIAMPVTLGIAAVLTLIILLAARELAIAHGGSRLNIFARKLEILIIPLLLVFIFIVVTTIIIQG